ncbi:MAG: hypothetical protein H7222_13530 [Methylotenera sp.]|nr:hypothetical protein [Oligoflexia bacterium]
MQSHSSFTSRFPPAWTWLVDEAIPNFVKSHYSPKEGWKDKPFTSKDAEFFFKGIRELSELFTEDRPRQMPAYLAHPKYRSSYLLYFVPLQAAKFNTVFQLHPQAMEAAVNHGRKTGTLRILDLGAGPGTASLGFLLWFLDQKFPTDSFPENFKIEFEWFDTNRTIMEDGKALVEMVASHFPKLRGRVKVTNHTANWSQAPTIIKDESSLILMGHVLNESNAKSGMGAEGDFERNSPARHIIRMFDKMHGGGILMIEPAEKRSSQLISQIRDQIFESQGLAPKASSVWGPCLHAGRCPLAIGRDWCHFSIPAEIPGKWFKLFSKNMSSEKQWVKFSYVWLAAESSPSVVQAAHLRRVISDPMKKPGLPNSVLLCEPEEPGRLEVPAVSVVKRGDLVNIHQVLDRRTASKTSQIIINAEAERQASKASQAGAGVIRIQPVKISHESFDAFNSPYDGSDGDEGLSDGYNSEGSGFSAPSGRSASSPTARTLARNEFRTTGRATMLKLNPTRDGPYSGKKKPRK